MATEEDLKKAEADAEVEGGEEATPDASAAPAGEPTGALSRQETDEDASEEEDDSAPLQLGYQRYVYATYMAGALISAFLIAKAGHMIWYRLGQWKPFLGEPQDEILFPLAGVLGILIALYYWRRADTRQYVNEVAEELSKVTWPSRKEVVNSTTVVVFTTLFATGFFALMDRFWGFVTDKIYTF